MDNRKADRQRGGQTGRHKLSYTTRKREEEQKRSREREREREIARARVRE